MDPLVYDTLYNGINRSTAYKAAIAEALDVPGWIVPASAVETADLERLADALKLTEQDTFVDLACGMGGSSLWIAERTGACVRGVDFSAVAIDLATNLAAERGLEKHARFHAADACATALPAADFAGIVSIDSIQFMEPDKAIYEMARLLRPGGIAAILTWESLTDVDLSTVVHDYRPFFRAAGFRIEEHDSIPGARERELAYFRALLRREDLLHAEMGESAEFLLEEARMRLNHADKPARVRKVRIVARRLRSFE